MLGSIISGIGNLVGGIFGQNSQEDQINAQIRAQERFAKHAIQWRTDDANKAGIHPLYALGAQTHSFSPIGIGGNPLGEGIAAAGQDIGRAVAAGGNAGTRSFNNRMMQLQLQRGELENQLLASQIARINSPAQLAPAAGASSAGLIAGQAQSAPSSTPTAFGGPGTTEIIPMQRIASPTLAPWSEPSGVSDTGWAQTENGGWARVPSLDVKQRIEDQLIPELQWAARNVVAPAVTQTGAPPFRPAPGHVWVNNGLEWVQVKASGTPESSFDYLRD